MKRTIAAAVSMLLLAGLLVACSGSGNEGTEKGTNSAGAGGATQSGSAESASAQKYPDSFTYWVPRGTVTLKSNAEMALYKELEKITGTKVEFQHPPDGQATEQFNLMLASGDLPDVIEHTWSSSQPDKAIAEGKIIRLNELIEQYAPNLSKIFAERPYIKKEVMSADGNIFVFPLIGDDPRLSVFAGLLMRKDWLDKLQLEVPTTIDEWENVLTAFRDRDPNGNNERDEIPFLYEKVRMEYSYAFIGAFGITFSFFPDQGRIRFGPYEPPYKDFLALMNKWYEAGLIDKDYMTVDSKLQTAKVTNEQLGSLPAWLYSGLGSYMDLMKDKNPDFRMTGVPFPAMEAGGPLPLGFRDPIFYGIGAAISASAPNPEQIVAWLDYGYGEEGHMLYNFGIEGDSYTMVDGKPQFTDLILNNPNGLSVTDALGQYSVSNSRGPFEFNADANQQLMTWDEQREAQVNWSKVDFSKLMPTTYLTAEEEAEYSVIMADLETYREEMTNKFIMGALSLDKFDDYIATLKKMGIEQAIQIKQAAYDRYMNQ